jgi:integral membrane protein
MSRRRRGLRVTLPAVAQPQTSRAPSRKLLNAVLAVGIADALLLLVLLYFAFVDRSDTMVSVIGPIHGLGYLILLLMTGNGASKGEWGWWFPALVLVTGGPLGTIVGDLILRRRLR